MDQDNLLKMYMGGGSSGKFDDPFMLPSSDYVPEDLKSALDFCMFLYYLNPQYRRASQRVIRHFITEFEYPGDGSAEEKDRQDDYLKHNLRLHQAMAEMGDEWSCYGNAFYRIHFPFDRVLVDDRSDKLVEYSLDMFEGRASFILKEMKYEIPDPRNIKKKIKLPFRDIPTKDKNRIKLRKLDPRDVTIRHNFISGSNTYIYDFPKEIRKDCQDGKLYVVNEVPIAMLSAIKEDQDFLFNADEMFHFKAPTVSGISNKGWGLPETLANYRSLHQIQVYRKIDEAVGLDYMVPFRIFTPEPGSSETGVVRNLVLSQWKSQVEKIITNRRKDKFSMHAFPFPLKYQEFGAEGKNLAPKDLIEYQTNSMLDAMGYPAELFKGSLTVQQVPTAVRLFENSFMFVHLGLTDFAQWVCKRIARYMEEPYIEVTLQKPSLADNLDRQNIVMQLSSAGEISRKKAYSWLGITDAVDEKKERLEEDSEIQKIQIKQEEDLRREMESGTINQQLDQQAAAQQQQQGGGGGSPPGGSPNPQQQQQGAVSPMDVQGQAQELAQQWASLPEGERRKSMQQVKASDQTLYSLAKQFLEDMRNGAKSQGVQQMYQQAQGGQ